MTQTKRVFLSHGSENREEANALTAFLEGRGISVWIAPRDVRPGMDYSEQLQLAIEAAGAFVVLVTDKANRSPYVRAETEMAFSTEKPIFPVRLSDIAPAPGLALFLKIRHWTDAFGPGRDAALDRLATELKAWTAPADAPAPVEPMRTPTPPPASAPSGSSWTPLKPAAAAPVQGGSFVAHPAEPRQPEPAAAPAGPASQEELRAAIGAGADYYTAKFAKLRDGGGAASWNWPAFFVSGIWLAYRRMWKPFGMFLVLWMLAQASGLLWMGLPTLLSIGLAIATGIFGNHLYRRHVQGVIASVSSGPREERLRQIAARGGTSTGALFGALALFFVLGFVSLAILGNSITPTETTTNTAAPATENATGVPPGFGAPAEGTTPPAADPSAPAEQAPLTDEEAAVPAGEKPLPEEEPAY